VAYGDASEHGPGIPWEKFEYMEYLYRLEDLLRERSEAFAIAHGNPDDPRAAAADEEWRRLDKQIEETALELAAYAARRRLEREGGPS
jgi:glyoxylase-like metal-dependent hydrolase (beta-lactamase superfamily II)